MFNFWQKLDWVSAHRSSPAFPLSYSLTFNTNLYIAERFYYVFISELVKVIFARQKAQTNIFVTQLTWLRHFMIQYQKASL